MFEDQRKHERKNVRSDEITGSFFIELQDESIAFSRVNDVSISGTGLVLERALEPGREIRLKFTSGDWQITIKGEVVWCDEIAEEPGAFRMGIEFDQKDMENNSLFFLALREYIDHFA